MFAKIFKSLNCLKLRPNSDLIVTDVKSSIYRCLTPSYAAKAQSFYLCPFRKMFEMIS